MAKGSKKNLKLLVCSRGKKCCKKGGEKVLQVIEANLALLADGIEVKPSKCLGMCKSGPSLVVMPGKIKHRQVSPKNVCSILKDPTAPSTGKRKK